MRAAFAVVLYLYLVAPAAAQGGVFGGGSKPTPDLANVVYGDDPQFNTLDLWKAKTAAPAPLVVFIHGGGFIGGSKEQVAAWMLNGCLARGISVISINYRLAPQHPLPQPYQDCARAIQFARLHAKEWNIDPTRIAASGTSAGGGTSLWLAFHPDLAAPASPDPVLRESSRLTCVGVGGAQCSYDPRIIREWIGGATAKAPPLRQMYDLSPDETDSPKAHALYESCSAITYLSKNAAPVFAVYGPPDIITPQSPPGTGIHSYIFGVKLKERMDALGVECIVHYPPDRDRYNALMMGYNLEMLDFFGRHFGLTRKATSVTP